MRKKMLNIIKTFEDWKNDNSKTAIDGRTARQAKLIQFRDLYYACLVVIFNGNRREIVEMAHYNVRFLYNNFQKQEYLIC